MEAFVCKAYCPKATKLKRLEEARYHIFKTKLGDPEKLPPYFRHTIATCFKSSLSMLHLETGNDTHAITFRSPTIWMGDVKLGIHANMHFRSHCTGRNINEYNLYLQRPVQR